jgi:uncharacterized protein YgiM (DUF1202 family)
VVATFTLSELAGAAAVCWWGTVAAVIGLLIGAGRRRTMRRVGIALGALTLVLAGFAIARWWGYHAVDRAVVATESAQMRTGPGDSFEVALSVQEGWMVRVLREDGDWAEVVGEGGATGWLPAPALAMVRTDAAPTGATDG